MRKKVAILGNPNSGKSSVFNRLTGLSTKVGNFPGITVDKKAGTIRLSGGEVVEIIDFPGVYSLHPNAKDEFIVTSILSNPKDQDYPDLILYVADITHLEKQLLLFTQVVDLGLPIVMVLTMKDLAQKDNLTFDLEALRSAWQIPILSVNARTQESTPDIISAIEKMLGHPQLHTSPQYKLSYTEQSIANDLNTTVATNSSYQSLLVAHYFDRLEHLSSHQKDKIRSVNISHGFNSLASQISETMQRYDGFIPLIRKAASAGTYKISKLSEKADVVLTHKIWGLIIFFAVNFFIFQAMFSLAAYPMEWIEFGFSKIGGLIKNIGLPDTITSFISDGILAGLGGILVFLPQIALLFFFTYHT